MIRVFIVDDHPVVIEGIHSLLQNEKDIFWAGQAMNASSCLGYFVNNTADVVLMDINMPGMDGIELCATLKERYPGIFILGLSTFNQGIYIKKMMENGASGYILKNDPPHKYLEAITEVYNGGAPVNASVAKKMLGFFTNKNVMLVSPGNTDFQLSEREKELLRLMVEGHDYKAIAATAFISYETVRTHVKHIYKKLHVVSRSEAVMKATQHGLA